MHLYDEILEKYVARELPQETLSSIDAHVSNCLFCAHTLAAQRSVATRWERRGWLGRLIRLDESPIADPHVDERGAKAA